MTYDHKVQCEADLRALRWMLFYNLGLACAASGAFLALAVFSTWSPLWALLLLVFGVFARVNVGARPKREDGE